MARLTNCWCACARTLGTRAAQTLEVLAQTPVAPVSARRLLKEPLADLRTLRRPVESALFEALALLSPLPPIILDLEIRLGGLVSASVQDVLFPDEKGEKSKTLARTVERLEARFAGMTGRYELRDPHSPFPEDAFGWLGALEAVTKERRAKPPRQEGEVTVRQLHPVNGEARRDSSVVGESVRVHSRGALPEAVEWRGRTFVVAQVLAMWCVEGRWWLDEARTGARRRYFRLCLQTPTGQALCVDVFRSNSGEWRLWRLAD